VTWEETKEKTRTEENYKICINIKSIPTHVKIES